MPDTNVTTTTDPLLGTAPQPILGGNNPFAVTQPLTYGGSDGYYANGLGNIVGSDGLRVTEVYLVRPDVLAIQINAGQVTLGTLSPYVAQVGDVINNPATYVVSSDGQIVIKEYTLTRNGVEIGQLVGDRTYLRTYDQFTGLALDADWATQEATFSVRSSTDTDFASGVNPTDVFRKSEPIGYAQTGYYEKDWAVAHTIYLDLPTDFKAGQTYEISFGANSTPMVVSPTLGDGVSPADARSRDIPAINFTFNPTVSQTEAIHVTQIGLRPDDPVKRAYVSTWMGANAEGIVSGLTYDYRLPFSLIDNQTNQVVYSGFTELQKDGNDGEPFRGGDNFAKTDTLSIDFGDFRSSGSYRIAVEGIGTSLPFEIKADSYGEAFYIAARGLYHQRNGIALEAPYTTVQESLQPWAASNAIVYQSNASLIETGNGFNRNDNNFTQLVNQRTSILVEEDLIGGYADAGDWDPRAQHLVSSRRLLELLELYPDYFNTFNLNIPESNNNLPDILDEALWGLELYKRLQTANGGIRGGFEFSGHPGASDNSALNTLEVFVYDVDQYSSFTYAATAAQAARVLRDYDPVKANDYQESALRALSFGEATMTTGNAGAEVLAIRDKLIRERDALIIQRAAEGREFLPEEARNYAGQIRALEEFANSRDLQSFIDLKASTVTEAEQDKERIRTRQADLRKTEIDFFTQYEKDILEFQNRPVTAEERAEFEAKIKAINDDEIAQIQAIDDSIPWKLAGLDEQLVTLATSLSDMRNLATLEAYRATGNEYWHDQFLQTTAFTNPESELVESGHLQREAAFNYIRLTGPTIRTDVQANAREAINREAGMQTALSFYTSNNWTKASLFGPVFFGNGLGIVQNQTLLNQYYLTGDSGALTAAIHSTQYIYGANSKNMTYTTGLGLRNPDSALIIDQRSRGVEAPPGIALYGPFDPSSSNATSYFAFSNDFDFLGNVVFPSIDKWAASESFFDAFLVPVNTEFTIHETIAPNTYTLGVLAARNGATTPVRSPNPAPTPPPTPPLTPPLIDQLVTVSNENTQIDPLALLNLVNNSTNGTPTIVYAPSGPQAISVPLAPGVAPEVVTPEPIVPITPDPVVPVTPEPIVNPIVTIEGNVPAEPTNEPTTVPSITTPAEIVPISDDVLPTELIDFLDPLAVL